MKIALLQLNMVVGDLEGNSRKIVTALRAAQRQGADLCITSEMALLGYQPRDLLLNRSFVEQAGLQAKALARELRDAPALLLGSVERNPRNGGNPLYNAALLLSGGKITKRFYKSLLPTYDVFDEHRYFEPAAQPKTFSLKGVKFGVTICEDVWNDVDFWPARRYRSDPLVKLAQAKVDCIVNLSASPFTLGKQKIRESMLSRIAKKYRAPLVYVNQVGGNDDLVFDGRSSVFDKQGKLMGRCRSFGEDVLMVDLPAKAAAIAADDRTEEAEAWQALVLATRDYATKCRFKKVLLGLSGGVDSALTAAIAAEALGPDNVLAVLMPSPYSSKGSIDDSLALAKNINIRTLILPIADIMKSYDAGLQQAFQGYAPDIAEENIQARIRGNLLMAMSNKYKALLLTTGNKSELAVGYCTIYGDMSGGFAVISDVPKTLVYRIVKWLNKTRGRDIIPAQIIDKAPSAELKPNQTDQDSLPPYDVLDDILQRYIERHESALQIIKAGFDKDVVNKVLKLVAGAEFKRKQAAPGVKITDRAFGTGWRMPIACKTTL